MYERFTDRAREVMQLANQEAIRFHHHFIGTEHILLGLLKEDSGVAANVLKNLGVNLGKICEEIEKVPRAKPDVDTMGKLLQTPRAKTVIAYAIEESRNLKHNYVGTEHLLLGLIRDQEGVAAQVLMKLGLSLELVRQEVRELLGPNLEAAGGAVLTKPVEVSHAEYQLMCNDPYRIFRESHRLIGLIKETKENALATQELNKAAWLRDLEDKLTKLMADFVGQWPQIP